MKRREFITLLGSAVAWPTRAQQPERMRRIGALLSLLADDPLSETVVAAFSQGLQQFGWTLGRNVRIEYRWAAIDETVMRQYATELVAFAPDVILAFGSVAAKAVERESREVPIVFVNASDPVGAGLVESLARPGGQATGFLSIEPGMSTKWLELLPRLARLAPQDCYEQKRAHEQPAAAFADSDRLRLGTQVVPLCRQQPQTVPSQSKLRA